MKICLLNMLILFASGSLGGRQIFVQGNFQARKDGGTDFGLVADGSVADEYGIVMGSSHIEPMLRNNIAGAEWDREYPGEPWDYVKNREHIYKYWEERVKENGKYENIYTMGKRGKDDEAGSDITVSVPERIFADQRDILKRWVNKDITKVPQVLTPYTEVLGLYNKGPKVPDDVIICWPDDNFGNIRQLPDKTEQQRSGSSGIYYHFQWLNGVTTAYPWLYTTPLALTWSEMKKAYDYNVRDLWIVNVGDIKPAEIGIEYFMQMVWYISAFKENNPVGFLIDWASRDFGKEYASRIAAVMAKHYELGYQHRPESMVMYKGRTKKYTYNWFGITNYNDEAQKRVDEYDKLIKGTDEIYNSLPVEMKDSFFQTVAYNVKGAGLHNKKAIYAQKSYAYGQQNRASAAVYETKLPGFSVYNKDKRFIDLYNTGNGVVYRSSSTGFVGSNGYISIEAEHYSRKVDKPNASWNIIEGPGRTGNSIIVLPTNIDSNVSPADIISKSPAFEYDFYAFTEGQATIHFNCIPSNPINADHPDSAAQSLKPPGLQLLGNRFFTFNTVVRVNQIETSRDITHGEDESSIHSPKEARAFRQAVEKGWPGARITWAFSWLALKDQRPNYRDLKKLVVSYHKKYGDEITFIPGGYFANMYNTRQQVNLDLHDGLQMVSDMVGDGYRPQSVIAGFLSAENLRFLAEEEGIHVCQGNIWSQYAIDNGDGEGSISYPYYPSREHFCKPAQGKEDLIDCVNLDGWTMDFLSAKYPGGRTINGEWCGSRQGVGPIETVIRLGTERGTKEMLATTAAHFDKGFELNDFAWVTCIWELGLVEGRKIYGYKGRNGLDGLVIWLSEMRRRWPEAKCITQGEFGMLWRKQFKNNDDLNYRFVQRGSGICGSDPDMEIRWFMNKDFRLALLRNWKAKSGEKLIDFTRYDLKAREPADPKPGQHTRNWSLLNKLNQKGIRPQDKPIPIGQLNADEQAIIKRRYPELINGGVCD